MDPVGFEQPFEHEGILGDERHSFGATAENGKISAAVATGANANHFPSRDERVDTALCRG